MVKTTARLMMPEVYNILYIVMPDEDLIYTRFMNYFDQDRVNRCEIGFFAPCGTAANLAPNLVEKSTSKHKKVLDRPYRTDCELCKKRDNGADFAAEFWVDGIDDGNNKYVYKSSFNLECAQRTQYTNPRSA